MNIKVSCFLHEFRCVDNAPYKAKMVEIVETQHKFPGFVGPAQRVTEGFRGLNPTYDNLKW